MMSQIHEERFFTFDEPNTIHFDADDIQEELRAFTHSSSFVGNVRYSPETKLMTVTMNGKRYDFPGIEEREFDAFEGAPSKGAHLNRFFLKTDSGFSETTMVNTCPHSEKMRAEGIPEDEIQRVLQNTARDANKFDYIEVWPPKIDGIHSLPTVDMQANPSITFPPFVENLSIPNSLSGASVGGAKTKCESCSVSAADSFGAKQNAEPSMHNEEGHNIHKNIPGIPRDFEDPSHIKYTIQETMSELKSQFRWLTPDYIQRAKNVSGTHGGAVLLIRAASETVTDHRASSPPGSLESQFRRLLTGEELNAMARTGIGKGSDINHLGNAFQTQGVVLDGEYDPQRKEIQFIHYERDQQIIEAIQTGTITAVSINGGPPRSMEKVCDGECYAAPRGVVLGEKDNIAFTYVITDTRGFTWKGQHLSPETPGVKNTKIEIL